MSDPTWNADADAAAGLSLIDDVLGPPVPASASLLESGLVPRCFDGLELGACLGRGGMGEVYAATRLADGCELAVKLRLAPGCQDDVADALLQREASLLQELDDPGLVTAHGTGRVEGRRYLVMERLRGASLAMHLQDGLPVGQALDVLLGLARCLRRAHARGVAHRDLKPSNVFLLEDDGRPLTERVRLLDFGIAGRLFEGARESGFGTWRYMAPEQRDGRGAGPPADIFAMAVLLERIIDAEWVRVPASVRALHRRMRAEDPARRPSLDEVLQVVGRPRRSRALLAVVAASVLVLAIAWLPLDSGSGASAPPAVGDVSTPAAQAPGGDPAPSEVAPEVGRIELHALRLKLERAERGGPALSPVEADALASHLQDVPIWLRSRVVALLERQGHSTPRSGVRPVRRPR